jgi:CubicO group peptidase (beta-lactamase class C family)
MGESDYHLRFTSKGQESFEIGFQQTDEISDDFVTVAGKNYRLLGDEFKVAWFKKRVLDELPDKNFEAIAEHLISDKVGARDVELSQKAHLLAMDVFSKAELYTERPSNKALDLEVKGHSAISKTDYSMTSDKAVAELKASCPKGAGSMMMISTPEGNSNVISAGSTEVNGKPINGQTAGLIGSGSKMFTSLCAMALITRGLTLSGTGQPLSLDTKISDVFSEKQMAIFDDAEKSQNLTLRMLLSHTSGLVYFADDNRGDRAGKSLSDILDEKEAGSVKFYGNPGDGIYSYSNHIGLAAAMIEIACGKPYEEVLRETVLEPLGMERSSYACPDDDNVLLAYKPAPNEESQATSEKLVVTDPMMQGAGGMWTCMDDMAKLGGALGKAVKDKGALESKEGKTLISEENLQEMMKTQAENAPCGLALDLQGDMVGKGGGIYGYDFKFYLDRKSGNAVSTLCNHAGVGDFARFLAVSVDSLKALNPAMHLPEYNKAKALERACEPLSIDQCDQFYKGFSGIVAFEDESPLTRMNFNGTTLPLEAMEGDEERYLIAGNSPFSGKELHMVESNGRRYPCFVDGMEVWSFGLIEKPDFPTVDPALLAKMVGDYLDSGPGGAPPHQIRFSEKEGMTLSFPGQPESPCLITSHEDDALCFRACIGGGPQVFSFKLSKTDQGNGWKLQLLNGETDIPVRDFSSGQAI